MDDGKPTWNDVLAAELLGKVALVGITRKGPTHEAQEQFFGTVQSADPTGISLKLAGNRTGEDYMLPPHPENFFPANPGSYRLRQTGETVENPDYTTTWTIVSDEDPVHQ